LTANRSPEHGLGIRRATHRPSVVVRVRGTLPAGVSASQGRRLGSKLVVSGVPGLGFDGCSLSGP